MKLGTLCSGYDGIALALRTVPLWQSEVDPHACTILAHRWPGVPNLGDLTAIDWATVPPVDVLAAGFPCQPVSQAGLRKVTNDDRYDRRHLMDGRRRVPGTADRMVVPRDHRPRRARVLQAGPGHLHGVPGP